MKKVVVRGPALSQSGYGEHTRFVLRSLRSRPDLFEVFLLNVNWGETSWIWEDNDERRWIDQVLAKTIQFGQTGGQFDFSIQVTIGNEWEKIAPVNIAVTAGIESTKIAPVWIEKSQNVDKIITVSQHAKFGMEKTTYPAERQVGPEQFEKFNASIECPIDVIGYPIKQIEKAKLTIDLKYDFNFLTIGTWIPRKNLENTIKWFVEEFYESEVGLVVKTSISKNSLFDRGITENRMKELLQEYKDRTCEVVLVHGDMSEQEMTAIYQHPKIKCCVSLSHGEGFGLPLFEAAYNGLPVLAPNWSGHCDFLYMPVKEKSGKTKNTPMFTTVSYDIKPVQQEAQWEGVIQADSMWCFPKEWNYKKGLRSVKKDYGGVLSKAKKLKTYLNKTYTQEAQNEKIVQSIVDVFEQPFEEVKFFK